jgi:hypothetical protein
MILMVYNSDNVDEEEKAIAMLEDQDCPNIWYGCEGSLFIGQSAGVGVLLSDWLCWS